MAKAGEVAMETGRDSSGSYKWWLLAFLFVTFFLEQASRQVYNSALPQIKADFASLGVTNAQLGIVGTVFGAVFIALFVRRMQHQTTLDAQRRNGEAELNQVVLSLEENRQQIIDNFDKKPINEESIRDVVRLASYNEQQMVRRGQEC